MKAIFCRLIWGACLVPYIILVCPVAWVLFGTSMDSMLDKYDALFEPKNAEGKS